MILSFETSIVNVYGYSALPFFGKGIRFKKNTIAVQLCNHNHSKH